MVASATVSNVARNLLAAAASLIGLVLLVPLIVLVAPFWLVAAGTRGLARILEPRVSDWTEIIDFERDVGWKVRPDVSTHVADFNGDPFRVTTDGAGWRGRVSPEESDVIVFGDSFAFGHAADDHILFSERAPGIRIKGIGAPGYSMVQSLLWMRRLAPSLRGKLVVWMIYTANDLDDNLRPWLVGRPAPFVRRNGRRDTWEIAVDHVRPGASAFDLRRLQYEAFADICRESFLAERAFSACEYLIAEAQALCGAVGASLVVMTVPELSPLGRRHLLRVVEERRLADFDPDYPDRRIGQICAALGVRFVPLGERLTADDYRAHDFHWNARGHRRVAGIIAELHREWRSAGSRPDGSGAPSEWARDAAASTAS